MIAREQSNEKRNAEEDRDCSGAAGTKELNTTEAQRARRAVQRQAQAWSACLRTLCRRATGRGCATATHESRQAGEIEEVRPHLPQGGGADISRISALQRKRLQIARYAMAIFRLLHRRSQKPTDAVLPSGDAEALSLSRQ